MKPPLEMSMRATEALRAALVDAWLRRSVMQRGPDECVRTDAERRAHAAGYIRYALREHNSVFSKLTPAGRAELERLTVDRDALIASIVVETFAAAFREIEVALMRRGELVGPLSPQIHARYAVRHNIPSLRGPL